jgi:uncharacterized protein
VSGTIDRIGPTRRPGERAIGSQKWRDLLFLHWSFPPELVRPLVPASLELDLWEGRAWVGIIPFVMREIRPAWWPRRLALNFLETNVRTYVHTGGRPGIWFFSLEASSYLAVKGARVGWGLPYFFAAMRIARDAGAIEYESIRRGGDRSGRGARHAVRYRPGELLGPSAPGTFDHFLLERYLLFAVRRGRLLEGQVHHPPYPAQRAEVDTVTDELLAAAGLPAPDRPPETIHFASGVDVEVFRPRAATRPADR